MSLAHKESDDLLRRVADVLMVEGRPAAWMRAERAALKNLSEEERGVVERGLHVLLDYEEREATAAEAAKKAADALSISTSAFYALRARARRSGLVAALTKKDGRHSKAAMYRDGLPAPYEGRLRELLREEPDVRVSDAYAALSELAPAGRRRLPSDDTVARRLAELRRSMPRGFRPGRSISLLQSKSRRGAGEVDVTTALVDDDSELIFGWAVRESASASFIDCRRVAEETVRALAAEHRIDFAKAVESLSISLDGELRTLQSAWVRSSSRRMYAVQSLPRDQAERWVGSLRDRFLKSSPEARADASFSPRNLISIWNEKIISTRGSRKQEDLGTGEALLKLISALGSGEAAEDGTRPKAD